MIKVVDQLIRLPINLAVKEDKLVISQKKEDAAEIFYISINSIKYKLYDPFGNYRSLR